MSDNGPKTPDSDRLFLRRLTVVTFSVLLVVLVIHLLRELKDILQPLFIAMLITYAILPPHRWLVRRGIRPSLAYILLVVILLAGSAIVGQAAYHNISEFSQDKSQLDRYRDRIKRLESSTARVLESAGVHDAEERLHRAGAQVTPSKEAVFDQVQHAASGFVCFLSFALIALVYLVFLAAEKISFDRRMALAFGEARAGRIAELVQSINQAIGNYIAVKAWISLVTALMSLGVFLFFGVDFAVFWAALIFLLNFVPYIGGLVAMGPPVVLAFLQHDSIWPGVIVIVLLTGIQLFTGQIVEPRIAGNRLNLSPLLILLSLAFWGSIWSIPGMLLAVPLTVVIKIILDHIPETRPIATLM